MNKNQRAQQINTKKKGKDTEDNKNKGVNKKKGIFLFNLGFWLKLGGAFTDWPWVQRMFRCGENAIIRLRRMIVCLNYCVKKG